MWQNNAMCLGHRSCPVSSWPLVTQTVQTPCATCFHLALISHPRKLLAIENRLAVAKPHQIKFSTLRTVKNIFPSVSADICPWGHRAVVGFLWWQSWLRAVLFFFLWGIPLFPCSLRLCREFSTVPESFFSFLIEPYRHGASHLRKTLQYWYSALLQLYQSKISLQLYTPWSTEPKGQVYDLSGPITPQWRFDFSMCWKIAWNIAPLFIFPSMTLDVSFLQ